MRKGKGNSNGREEGLKQGKGVCDVKKGKWEVEEKEERDMVRGRESIRVGNDNDWKKGKISC